MWYKKGHGFGVRRREGAQVFTIGKPSWRLSKDELLEVAMSAKASLEAGQSEEHVKLVAQAAALSVFQAKAKGQEKKQPV